MYYKRSEQTLDHVKGPHMKKIEWSIVPDCLNVVDVCLQV